MKNILLDVNIVLDLWLERGEYWPDYTRTKHCIGVASGTDALLMSLMAWDIGHGGAVFTTPFTFITSAIDGSYQDFYQKMYGD